MGQSPSEVMQNQIFELKFAAKQLERASKKAAAAEKKERKKLYEDMKKGNSDIARIHAENAIRQKNQSLNYLRLASRLDAVSSKLQSAANVQALSKTMTNVSKIIGGTIKTMDFEKAVVNMENFEKQCEELDVQLGVMEQSMQMSTSSSMPEEQVETLMRQVAEENGLELQESLDEVAVPKKVAAKEEKKTEADLAARLKELTEKS